MKTFISYSQRDFKNYGVIVHDYLEDLFPKSEFYLDQTDYKGKIIEDSIRQNLEASQVFILIITPAALISKAVKEEIKMAKELNLTIIPCKTECFTAEWDELPLDSGLYHGITFNYIDDLLIRLYKAIKEITEIELKNITPSLETNQDILKIHQSLKKEKFRIKAIYDCNVEIVDNETNEIIEILNGKSDRGAQVNCQKCHNQYCKHIVFASNEPDVQDMWKCSGITNPLNRWNEMKEEAEMKRSEFNKTMDLVDKELDKQYVIVKDSEIKSKKDAKLEIKRGRIRCNSCNNALNEFCRHALFIMLFPEVFPLLQKEGIIPRYVKELEFQNKYKIQSPV